MSTTAISKAVGKVIDTPELLEHVLFFLVQKSLIRALQVNKSFCDLITRYKRLRRQLWLECALPNPRNKWPSRLLLNPIIVAKKDSIGVKALLQIDMNHKGHSQVFVIFRSFNDIRHTTSSHDSMLVAQDMSLMQGKDVDWVLGFEHFPASRNRSKRPQLHTVGIRFSGSPPMLWQVKEALLERFAMRTYEEESPGEAGGAGAA